MTEMKRLVNHTLTRESSVTVNQHAHYLPTSMITDDCEEVNVDLYMVPIDAGQKSLEEMRGRAAGACHIATSKNLSQVYDYTRWTLCLRKFRDG